MTNENNAPRAGRSGADASGWPSYTPWMPPERSDVARIISLRSKGSLRGELTVDGAPPRTITYESHLEKKVLVCLLARPDVAEVYEQPRPTVIYRDLSDTWREHTFDFLVIRRSGERNAISVKPSGSAERHDLEGTLRLVAAYTAPAFATSIVLMTEHDVPRDAYHNACLILAMREEVDEESDRAVATLVENLNGTTSVGALVDASGLHADGFAAVVRLIGDGGLRIVGRNRIDHATTVARGHGRAAS